MTKKRIVAVSLVLAVVLAAALAFADGSHRGGGGWGRSYGGDHMYERGWDRGGMMGGMMGRSWGRMMSGMMDGMGWFSQDRMSGGRNNFDQNDPRAEIFENTAKERNEIQRKQLELKELWLAEELDEAKIKAVQNEINDLRNTLSNKMMSQMIELKKNNPDWQP